MALVAVTTCFSLQAGHEALVAHSTDRRLLETARANLVDASKGVGVELKQTFHKEGQYLDHKAGLYAHAHQFKCMKRAIKRQRTIFVRLQRKIDRMASAIGPPCGKHWARL